MNLKIFIILTSIILALSCDSNNSSNTAPGNNYGPNAVFDANDMYLGEAISETSTEVLVQTSAVYAVKYTKSDASIPRVPFYFESADCDVAGSMYIKAASDGDSTAKTWMPYLMEDLGETYLMTYQSLDSDGYLEISTLINTTMISYKNSEGVCTGCNETGYFDTVRAVSPTGENFQDPKAAVGPVRVGF